MRIKSLLGCLCLLATMSPFIWYLLYSTQYKELAKTASSVYYPMNSGINQEAWKVFSCEELKVAKEPPSTINFFASAVGLDKYEMLLPMYVFFALSSHRNVDAVAEIIVPDAKAFFNRTENVLVYLQSTFSTPKHAALCVREYTGHPRNRTGVTNTWRYLEVPHRFSAKYTYIGDVDIFILSSVLVAGRFKQMSEFNLPYSNIIRDYDAEEKRLTGVMLAETSRFYTDKLLRAQANLNAKGNDEHFLYRIVKEAGFGIPPRNSTARVPDTNELLVKYRPLHGIHLSFNRGPGARMCLSSQNLFFEGMLKFDGLDEFLHHDLFANDYFDTIKAKFEEQSREDMIVFNHTCQPRRNTLNQTLTH